MCFESNDLFGVDPEKADRWRCVVDDDRLADAQGGVRLVRWIRATVGDFNAKTVGAVGEGVAVDGE